MTDDQSLRVEALQTALNTYRALPGELGAKNILADAKIYYAFLAGSELPIDTN